MSGSSNPPNKQRTVSSPGGFLLTKVPSKLFAASTPKSQQTKKGTIMITKAKRKLPRKMRPSKGAITIGIDTNLFLPSLTDLDDDSPTRWLRPRCKRTIISGEQNVHLVLPLPISSTVMLPLLLDRNVDPKPSSNVRPSFFT
ncbi:unnamed protein product [Cylindrotheca closterium]|uniref:Uncharacterized protein n=1 Tax=Cylindrotheca closterium TaxID=2856 RepID=A0AAD2FLG1_9STRA|nr:unnamed protein product [Cylindrotheca closterium]